VLEAITSAATAATHAGTLQPSTNNPTRSAFIGKWAKEGARSPNADGAASSGEDLQSIEGSNPPDRTMVSQYHLTRPFATYLEGGV